MQNDDKAGDDEGLEKHRHQQRSERREKAKRVAVVWKKGEREGEGGV